MTRLLAQFGWVTLVLVLLLTFFGCEEQKSPQVATTVRQEDVPPPVASPPPELLATQRAFIEVSQQVTPAVVNIRAERMRSVERLSPLFEEFFEYILSAKITRCIHLIRIVCKTGPPLPNRLSQAQFKTANIFIAVVACLAVVDAFVFVDIIHKRLLIRDIVIKSGGLNQQGIKQNVVVPQFIRDRFGKSQIGIAVITYGAASGVASQAKHFFVRGQLFKMTVIEKEF